MRLFLALELPPDAQERLRRLGDRLRPLCPGWRWLPPANLHLTLRFLGVIDETSDRRQRDRWRESVQLHRPLRFRLGPAGAFPSRGRPRALVVHALDGAAPGAIEALARSLEAAARSAGLAPEERPFRAHVTVARARAGESPTVPPGDFDLPPFAVAGTAVTLFGSELRPQGARYSVVERFPLGDSDPASGS